MSKRYDLLSQINIVLGTLLDFNFASNWGKLQTNYVVLTFYDLNQRVTEITTKDANMQITDEAAC